MLIEFDMEGPSFTHTNNQHPYTLSRLDRAMASVEWFELFLGYTEKAIGFYKLNHRFLRLCSSSLVDGGPRSF